MKSIIFKALSKDDDWGKKSYKIERIWLHEKFHNFISYAYWKEISTSSYFIKQGDVNI